MAREGSPAVAFGAGLVLIIVGLWILLGLYPFTGEVFAFPSYGLFARGVGGFMSYFWWVFFKVGMGVGMPVFGTWILINSFR